jgi:hypothetical protein
VKPPAGFCRADSQVKVLSRGPWRRNEPRTWPFLSAHASGLRGGEPTELMTCWFIRAKATFSSATQPASVIAIDAQHRRRSGPRSAELTLPERLLVVLPFVELPVCVQRRQRHDALTPYGLTPPNTLNAP